MFFTCPPCWRYPHKNFWSNPYSPINIYVQSVQTSFILLKSQAVRRTGLSYRDGRKKKYTPKQMEHALAMLKKNSYNKVAAMTGISKSTFIRANKEKIK
jgi:DNA invertase Pin-like site-specific DNA recombinase